MEFNGFTDCTQPKFNKFVNLDEAEDRIIYYLLSPNKKNPLELEQTYNIWKLLYYSDENALNEPLPKYSDIIKLIYNGEPNQSEKRIFRSPRLEDAFTEQCTLLKIYIDSIMPQNAYLAQVNYGIDVLCHNKIINVKTNNTNLDGVVNNIIIDEVDGIPIKVQTKSRITVLTKAVLSILNGADIAGVGQLQFNSERFRYNQAQYGLWNNRNFEGMKIVMGALQSGVGK